MMGRLAAAFRQWDRPTQVALGLAVAFLAVAVGLYLLDVPDLREPATVAMFGLVIIIQIIVMWGNRGMVTPYTRAQRLYLAGEMPQAIDLLELYRGQDKADFRMLTLLGNAYRQVGELQLSEQALCEALALRPNHHFPQYGFGRTLLIQGYFADAIEAFQQAHEAGAPDIVQADLGEAYYRAGDLAAARQILERAVVVTGEPYQALMTTYLLYRLDAGPPPDADLLQAGLPYWEAASARFAQIPYGQMLADDIDSMRAITQEK